MMTNWRKKRQKNYDSENTPIKHHKIPAIELKKVSKCVHYANLGQALSNVVSGFCIYRFAIRDECFNFLFSSSRFEFVKKVMITTFENKRKIEIDVKMASHSFVILN